MKTAIAVSALAALLPFANAQLAAYAQCGGQGWSGSSQCVSGYVCTYSSQWYSQCVPGSASSSGSSSSSILPSVTSTSTSIAPISTSSSASTTTTVAGSTPSSASLPFLGGVNVAGWDFGMDTSGDDTGSSVAPPVSQFQHFASQGVNIFRVPFKWQTATPTLGGTISSSFLSEYDVTVNAALATGAYVIIDLHNYARWNGNVIGTSNGPTNAQFASVWSQLAAHYASNPKIIFGIMNEPHDISNIPAWATSVQAAVTAIRQAGATSQYMLLPGSTWAHASALPTEAGPSLLKVTDFDGSVNKLLFDVHQYLDSDGSGTHTTCTTDNTAVFTTLYQWLTTNNRQALLSETGGGEDSSCYTDLNTQLAYVKAHSDRIVGYTIWAAGAFDPSYVLSVTPNSDGSDQTIWTQAVKPNLP